MEFGTLFAVSPQVLFAIGVGAVTGFVSAAKTDYDAFRDFKSLDEFTAYNWKLAAWRWAQGAFIGAVTASPFGKFVSF